MSHSFEHGSWTVDVTDQGPGLTETDRQTLFEYFATLSAKPTGGEASTGLGMAITRRAVEAHGGEIGVESRPGAGSRFWFTIPAAAAFKRARATISGTRSETPATISRAARRYSDKSRSVGIFDRRFAEQAHPASGES